MRSLDELTFQIELPLKPIEAVDRIDAACDDLAFGVGRRFGGVGTGRRRLWGSVGGHWFRVRAIGISYKAPAAEGYVVPAGTGSRVQSLARWTLKEPGSLARRGGEERLDVSSR